MGRVTVTVQDRATVTRSEVFLPAAQTHPAWVRGNSAPRARIGRDLGPEATRARVFNNGIDDLDVPPDSHNKKDEDFYDTSHVGDVCHCREPEEAKQRVTDALTSLDGYKSMRFFSHTDDAESVPHIKITLSLLMKLLEWSGEDAKTDEKRHQMLELLTQEAQGGKVLDMEDYGEP